MSLPPVNVALGVTGQEQVAAALRQLAQELAKVEQQSKKTSESALTLGKLFEGFIGFEIINRLREFGQEVFNSAVQIGKLSQITGVTAPTLSVMSSAANKLGIETQQLGKGIVFLESNIQKLQQGNQKAAQAFGLVGLSAKDFVGLNTDQKVLKVFDAIGKMKNGTEKAAAAAELMNKRVGAGLIPVLNTLAGEGFARVAEEAAKMSLIINDQTAQAAVAAAVAFKALEESAKGVVTQIEGGMLPALADAADELVEVGGQTTDGFRSLGEGAGNVIKFIEEGLLDLAEHLFAVWVTVKDVVVATFDTIVASGISAFHAIADAAHGDFSKAWDDVKKGGTVVADSWRNAGSDIVGSWREAQADIERINHDLWDPSAIAARQKRRLKDLQASPTGEDANAPIHPLDDKVAKARLALLQAQAQNELSIWKALFAAEEAEDKSAYDRGIVDVTEYFARRRAIVADSAGKEIAVLEAEYKRVAAVPAANEQQRLQRQKELEAIQTHIALIEVKSSQDQIELDRQEYDQKIELARQLESYQAEILAAQGNVFDAAMVKIGQEADAIRTNLAKAGLTPDQIDQVLTELQKAKVIAAEFDESRRQASLVQGASGLAAGNLDLAVESGDVLQVNRERELSAIYAEEVPQLQQIAAAMLEIAKLSGDPEKVLEAEQFAQQVQHIAIQADYARQQWVQFENTVVNGIQGDLSTFFTETINKAKSVGDAFEQLGLSISKTFQKAIGDYAAKQITQKLTGWLHLDSTNGGTQVAAAFAASSAQMITAGTTISSAALQLAAAAAELEAAANTLGLGSSGGLGGIFGELGSPEAGFQPSDIITPPTGDSGLLGTVPGLAGGGRVRGAGTSTSDSIPAYLSDGEYVTRAAAVRHYGVSFFHSLNAMHFARGGAVDVDAMRRGMVIPPIRQYSPAFAAGDHVAMRAAAPMGGDNVQRHIHEFPPEAFRMTFAEAMERLLANEWSRR